MATNSVKVEIITAKFNRMLEELAAIDAEVEFKDVVDVVGVRVAQGAMNRTRVASIPKIKASHSKKEWTTFNGRKIRIAGDDPWHFGAARFAAARQQHAQSLVTKLNARGLSRQSWLGFAAQLGRSLKPAPFVLAANYKGKQHGENSFAKTQGGASEYTLTLYQISPLIQAGQMERALFSAMNGETRYFYVNIERRAFRTIESRAAKYPGIFTKSTAALA